MFLMFFYKQAAPNGATKSLAKFRYAVVLFCILCAGLAQAQNAYVEEVFRIVEKHSLHRDSLDFKRIRKDAYAMLGDARTPADSYPTIRFILSELKDRHSFFMERKEVDQWKATSKMAARLPESPFKGERMINDIAYLQLQGFSSGDSVSTTEYANNLQKLIKSIDHKNVKGWILDLRRNWGGNCWPMVAGLGPLLGDGIAGYFIDNDGKKFGWYYRNGTSGVDTVAMTKVGTVPYTLIDKNNPIAVLTGPWTASSGEVVVTSFREKKNARSFGESTAGLSTGNSDYRLSDGSMIFVTTSIYADRLGNSYGGKIKPDYEVPFLISEINSNDDPVIGRAIRWIENGK